MEVVAEREVTAVQAGPVTVRKSALDLGREGVSGVKLEISSDSDHAVAVELHERVPGHVSLSDIQVHPQYRPGKWRKVAASHRLVFEDELPPRGSIETIYGVRLEPDQLGSFLEEPLLERVEADGDGEEGSSGGAAAAGASEATGSGQSDRPTGDPHGDTSGSAPDGAADPPAEPAGPALGEGSDRDPGLEWSPADGAEGGSTAAGPNGFQYGEDRPPGAGESGSAGAEASRRTDPADGAAPAAEVTEQLDALEASVNQLGSYVEALDARPDAPDGTAAVEEVRARQAEQAAALEELSADLGAESERRAELAERLREGAAERATLADRVGAAEDHRDDLSSRLRAEEDERRALVERVARLEQELVDLRDRYGSHLESLTGRVEELESTFSTEESRAIREVIAAERRWKRQRASTGRPARLSASDGRPG